MVRHHPYPHILDQIPRDKNAVIEASAGTGKTFTLEHLIVDRVLAGVPLERILVVTFTEKATAELRRRVRAKLIEVRTSTRDDPEGPSWPIDEEAKGRLSLAERRFPSAAISTIHSFCQRALSEHAFLSRRLFKETVVDGRRVFHEAWRYVVRHELAREPELVPFLETWLTEGRDLDELERLLFAVSRKPGVGPALDLFELERAMNAIRLQDVENAAREASAVRRVNRPWTAKEALQEVAAVISRVKQNGRLFELDDRLREPLDALLHSERRSLERSATGAALLPQLAALKDALAPLEVFLVHAILPRVEARAAEMKRSRGLVDFDDLLHLLDEALSEPERGETLAAALRARYRVALIDEFQDTDLVQWRIFRRLYLGREREERLYLIGDPKQAIYGFRGADVYTYLLAKKEIEAEGGRVVPLVECHRSTRALVEAYNHVILGTSAGPLFSGPVGYDHPAVAAPNAPRFYGPDGREAAPICLVAPEEPIPVGEMRTRLARWMIAEIRRLTNPAAPFRLGEAPVRLADIFVLTYTETEGWDVGDMMMAAGLPHRFFRQEGLFQSREARAWFDVLAAVLDPTDPARRNRAFLSPIFGLAVEEILRLGEASFAHPLVRRLFAWRELMEAREYGRLFSRVLADSGVLRREQVLGRGDRARTNYVQLAEILTEQVGRRKPSPEELVVELGRMIDEEDAPRGGPSANVLRVGAADDAVQIMTSHKSKGLEATVVFLFGGFWAPPTTPPFAYREQGQRRLDVRRAAALDPPTQRKVAVETREENERLGYVALTRAKGRLYLPFRPEVKGGGRYELLELRAQALAEKPGQHAEVRSLSAIPTSVSAPPEVAIVTPEEISTDAGVDAAVGLERLRRSHAGPTLTSYSRMKAELAGSRADARTNEDRVGEVEALTPPTPPADELPGGKETGILVHEVLERVGLDPGIAQQTPEVWAQLPEVAEVLLEAMLLYDLDRSMLPALARLCHRALSAELLLEDGRRLAGLASADRVVRELEFLFPLRGKSSLVIGFTDVVFEKDGKAYFLDWKTDLLPDYSSAALGEHVDKSYRLQVKLYSLALFRLLGTTTPEETAARFGGVLYVFMRGLGAGGEGQWFLRPTHEDLLAWAGELERGQAGTMPLAGKTSTPPPPLQFTFPFAPDDPTLPRKKRRKR